MKKTLVEFVGSFLFYLLIALIVGSGGAPAALGVGIGLMAIIYAGGPISGAHFNPAVTFALLIAKKIEIQEAVQYWIAQIVAGVLAFCLGGWLTGQAGGIAPGSGFSSGQAFLVETLLTFGLVFVVFHAAVSKRATPGMFGLAIGGYIIAAVLAGGAISGAGYNPAVAIGATVANVLLKGGSLSNLPIYIFGPLLGGAAAAFLFNFLESGE